RVTISGESAGAGAVMLLSIAKDGSLGTSLFSNVSAGPSVLLVILTGIGHHGIPVSLSTVRLQCFSPNTALRTFRVRSRMR
nr:hypothetical protein [Tanacetum cinerariifolium]